MRWTFEEKLKMVKDYLKDGTIPYVEHCSRKSLAHAIRLWARAYNLHGDAALKHKQNHVFTKKDKVNAVKRILAGQSNNSVSISLGIHPSTIAKWLEIYEKEGFKGLKDPLPAIKKTYLDINNREEQYLNVKHDDIKYQQALITIARQKAEIAYLKKLSALSSPR